MARLCALESSPFKESGCRPVESNYDILFDILPATNGEDSYGVAMIDSHGRFGGFLLHRPASLRRISTGFTLGLSGPRSVFQDAESL